MENKICPECNRIMSYSPYFNKMECRQCGYTEEVEIIKDMADLITQIPDNLRIVFKLSEGDFVVDAKSIDEIKLALQEKQERKKLQEHCSCKNTIKACCTCVSMKCHSCVKDKSEYIKGIYCSACGGDLKLLNNLLQATI